MDSDPELRQCQADLDHLCLEISNRSVGSPGNQAATQYFAGRLASLGWPVETREFEAMDWEEGGADLTTGGERFDARPSPYSLGIQAEATLVAAGSLAELQAVEAEGRLLLLHGEIAREQLMPKNFVFYNPEEHRQIIALLEAKQPAAILTATGRNSALAGGVYPFPLIEDGDFQIPSVYLTEEEGRRLLPYAGQTARLSSRARRIPSRACNVLGRKGAEQGRRVVITAHIDAKQGTPGAIDNATGVIFLLLLAGRLADYSEPRLLEIVALNGEDYYAVPGQMDYIARNQGRFEEMLVNINIDGAGYHEGPTTLSFFNLPEEIHFRAEQVLGSFPGLKEGPQWPQGDHSIFVQFGVPAIAVSSAFLVEGMESQEITHTPKDHPSIVDCRKLVEAAQAVEALVRGL